MCCIQTADLIIVDVYNTTQYNPIQRLSRFCLQYIVWRINMEMHRLYLCMNYNKYQVFKRPALSCWGCSASGGPQEGSSSGSSMQWVCFQVGDAPRRAPQCAIRHCQQPPGATCHMSSSATHVVVMLLKEYYTTTCGL